VINWDFDEMVKEQKKHKANYLGENTQQDKQKKQQPKKEK